MATGAVKICGYLEKKGKMKVVTTWKKYWFVLEGRLLLYYRSQEEYENLSPCKGSINMGLAVNIRPGLAAAGILEIVTRTNTITLKAKQRTIQEKWLQALMDASGQQSASSPVKMTHFRYSMDNLIPAPSPAKPLARQNTLPHRFADHKRLPKQLVTHLELIGARTYGGSLDSIVRKTRVNMSTPTTTTTATTVTATCDQNPKTAANTLNEADYEKNDLYDTNQVFVENVEYISSRDENKNDLLVENTDYLRTDELEYYCTYEDINGAGGPRGSCFEPDLPPRPPEHTRSESDDGSYTETAKKQSAFSKFAKKLKNFKTKNKSKKKCDENQEPFYDTVNYMEIKKQENAENLLKTLLDLKQTLEENKIKVKDIIESTVPKPTPNPQNEDATFDEASSDDTPEKIITNPPGLPPRSHKRPSSPYHDTPKNNSPVNAHFPSTIDQILNDLEQEQNEELNVRQLINKFNKIDPEDVNLRQKTEQIDEDASINRYSEDLNKLLEELTKVTSAPLLTPGVTCSLIQMKSPPVTDEEWLALTPIRRRRFSDPDYDVPRPHRSLQILAPPESDEKPDEVIPATRFFGPVLSVTHTETWRSMTPDSLEPTQVLQASMRRQHHHHHHHNNNNNNNSSDVEKDRSVGYESDVMEKNEHTKMAECLIFMDSLEPLSEGATAF